MAENNSSTQLSSRPTGVPAVAVLIMALVVLALAVAIMWITVIRNPLREHQEQMQDAAIRGVGFNESRRSTLSERFADADGDLIADAPKDSKQWLDPPVLTFSYVAVEDTEPFKEAWKDFEAYLAKQTGKKVEYLEVKAPEDQLKALRDGKLHVTALNTGLVPAGVNQCGFVPVATLGDEKGEGRYQIEIIVRPDSSIHKVEDLHGKELTLTEIGSNSGYKAPLVILKKNFSMLPFKDYLVRYSGGHEQSIAGIVSGDFEAVAVANDVLARDIVAGTIKDSQYRSIYKSDSFPKAAMGYVYNLSPALAAKVKQAILDFDWKGTSVEKRFAMSGQSKFVPVTYKGDWEQVRQIDDAVGQVYEIK